MTPLNHSDRVRRFLTPLLALSVALPAFAQLANTKEDKSKETAAVPVTAAPAKKEEVIELSPFTVTTTKDTGYFAQNTLAGSRMNTNLGDLGASISVYTREFLDDIGATNANELLIYGNKPRGAATVFQASVN